MRYAIAAADSRSLRRAAEPLHLKQSTLSRRVRELEEELGVLLLDYSQRYPGVDLCIVRRATCRKSFSTRSMARRSKAWSARASASASPAMPISASTMRASRPGAMGRGGSATWRIGRPSTTRPNDCRPRPQGPHNLQDRRQAGDRGWRSDDAHRGAGEQLADPRAFPFLGELLLHGIDGRCRRRFALRLSERAVPDRPAAARQVEGRGCNPAACSQGRRARWQDLHGEA